MEWHLESLLQAPKCRKAPSYLDYCGDVKPIFYDCGTWKNKPVKAFAWIGFPKNLAKGQQVPGIVLVHGGGGTAFPDWVRLWNERGYAAIAMDNCGGVPCWNECAYCRNPWPRHAWSGPAGWGNFGEIGVLPPEDHWVRQAASTVIAAHSLLRSFPQVAADRIGITGVSWGGVLTCIAAGLDSRFAFAAPVYGCGFLKLDVFGEFSQIAGQPEKGEAWKKLWDPSVYLPRANMPFLWVTGSNDFAFHVSMLRKSVDVTAGKSSLAVKVRMIHGHGGAGEKPPEILNFANYVTGFGESIAPADITVPEVVADRLQARYVTAWPVARAEMNYTCDRGPEPERLWHTAAAETTADGVVSAALPTGTSAAYFSLYSASELVCCSVPVLL